VVLITAHGTRDCVAQALFLPEKAAPVRREVA